MITDTVMINDRKDALVIIDQTLLPGTYKTIELRTTEEIYEAIKKLRVRGAPAIGVAAAFGVYLAARAASIEIQEKGIDRESQALYFFSKYYESANLLASARPTAVNLTWAVERMHTVIDRYCGPDLKKAAERRECNKWNTCGRREICLSMRGESSISEVTAALLNEAERIRDEDIEVCSAIGENGLLLLKSGMTILTHCNAGRLAAVRYGTALAPVYKGVEKGMEFSVFADETRPLLQGARLTSFELHEAGIDVTLICDNMASTVMKSGKIDAVITGCDRVAANGDAANKIGTSGVAILAKHYGIPFYIAAPTSTIDISCASGNDIVIEERDGEEIAEMWYSERMAPEGVNIYNPAFDVTDNSLITAIITEKGVITAPYDKSIAELFNK